MHRTAKALARAKDARKTAAFYNVFRPFYPLVDLFFRPQKRTLAQLLDALPQGRLLDLGAGNGSSFPAFRKHQLTGVDISPGMLRQARKCAPANASLLCADIHNLPFANARFDYVVLSHVLATVAGPEQVLSEAARVLQTGGQLFILNHFTPTGPQGLLDRIMQPFSGIFRFRSVFYEKDLPLPACFRKTAVQYWMGGYWGLLVYKKGDLE